MHIHEIAFALLEVSAFIFPEVEVVVLISRSFITNFLHLDD